MVAKDLVGRILSSGTIADLERISLEDARAVLAQTEAKKPTDPTYIAPRTERAATASADISTFYYYDKSHGGLIFYLGSDRKKIEQELRRRMADEPLTVARVYGIDSVCLGLFYSRKTQLNTPKKVKAFGGDAVLITDKDLKAEEKAVMAKTVEELHYARNRFLPYAPTENRGSTVEIYNQLSKLYRLCQMKLSQRAAS